MNLEQLKNIIDSNNFDAIIGQAENECLECKNGIYSKDENGRLELAKDVTAFANHKGGMILIGAKTKKESTQYGEIIESIEPFPRNLVDTKDYHNILKDWVYPKLSNVEINWRSIKQNDSKGIISIYVPLQPQNFYPFLIKKDIDLETNKKRKEIVFGYIERIADSNVPASIDNIQRLIQLGTNYDVVEKHLTSIETLLSSQSLTQNNNDDKKIIARIEESLKSAEIDTKRSFSLSAFPIPLSEIPDFFKPTPNKITNIIEKPPFLRENGWNLPSGKSKISKGKSFQISYGGYRIVEFYSDGNLVFSCCVDENYLCFSFGELQINTAALTESTYLFSSLFNNFLTSLTSTPSQIGITIHFQNLHKDNKETFIVPSEANNILGRAPLSHQKFNAPEDEFTRIIKFDCKNFLPEKIGYQILKEIYLWFGIEEDSIPYTNRNEGTIDINKILSK
ncbi:MAG: putative DNA binding domain-containing protein [Ignavibacteriales bacterium]|nr:putative DNA binding domain-containing protein [Ignavibacteriales bacterium]